LYQRTGKARSSFSRTVGGFDERFDREARGPPGVPNQDRSDARFRENLSPKPATAHGFCLGDSKDLDKNGGV